MPKRASKRASKRRKSKQIKKRRNTNKKRFFGGVLDASLIINSWSSKLYDDIPPDEKRQPHNPEVSRRNARFLNVMLNYEAGIQLFTWLSLHNMKGEELSGDGQILEKRLAKRIVGLDLFDNELIELLKQKDESVSVDQIKTKIDQYFNLDTVLFGVLKAKFIKENKHKFSPPAPPSSQEEARVRDKFDANGNRIVDEFADT